jgi:lipoate-protein ligase A
LHASVDFISNWHSKRNPRKQRNAFFHGTMVEIRKYDLPDFEIFYNASRYPEYVIWVPDDCFIVLGNSNKPRENLIIEHILDDGIAVYKRPSGGETVILTPNTLVISIKVILEKFSNPTAHFQYFNEKIIQALAQLGVRDLYYRGISDIAIGNKKILGSSIYRSRKVLFYHAVLNVSEDIHTIVRYIKHPGREPDYRNGRTHHDFVTSLYDEGYRLPMEKISDSLKNSFATLNEKEIKRLSNDK